MFTKEDYKKYFEQLAGIERLMIYLVRDMLLLIEDEGLKDTLSRIASDEVRHYEYVKQLFDSLLLGGEQDKRQFVRRHSLGRMKIKVVGKDIIFDAYCANISQTGVCIEFEGGKAPEGDLELWIEFFDKQEPQHHFGRIVWSAQIDPELSVGKINYKGGLEFQEKAAYYGK